MPERLNNVVGFSVERLHFQNLIWNVYPGNDTVVFEQGATTFTWTVPHGNWNQPTLYSYLGTLNSLASPNIPGFNITIFHYAAVVVRASSALTLKLSDPNFTLKAPFFSVGSSVDVSGNPIILTNSVPASDTSYVNVNSSALCAGHIKNQKMNINNVNSTQYKNFLTQWPSNQSDFYTGNTSYFIDNEAKTRPTHYYDKPRSIQEFDIYLTDEDGTTIPPATFNEASGYYLISIVFFMKCNSNAEY
jgi:hypothetical protein